MQCKRSRDGEAQPASAGSRDEPKSQLTNEQWFLIADLFEHPAASEKGGRPRVDARRCVEGILWVLRSGARWKDLPATFPSPTTCWRRHRQWSASGVWQNAWARLLRMLDRQGQLDWEESAADGTFSSAKKGASTLERTNGERAPRSWCTAMAAACLSQ